MNATAYMGSFMLNKATWAEIVPHKEANVLLSADPIAHLISTGGYRLLQTVN